MGYRSDVTAIFYDPTSKLSHDELLESMKEKFPQVFEHWPAVLGSGFWPSMDDDGTRKGASIIFQADYVKWYNERNSGGFADVVAFEDMLLGFNDNPELGAYEFGRVGEDHDDMEYKSSPNARGRMQAVRGWDVS